MPKPTILLVGGAWHPADYYVPLANAFHHIDYTTQTVPLASASGDSPPKGYRDDLAAIRGAATHAIIVEKRDVVVVLHSLGGILGTEALHGLSSTSPGKPGLRAIVYVAAMAPDKGQDFGEYATACGDATWAEARKALEVNGQLQISAEMAPRMFYNDIDEEAAMRLTRILKPQTAEISHDTYNEVPCGYVLASKDNAFRYEYQLETVKRRKFSQENTMTLDAGHTPWWNHAEEIRDFVLKIAG